MFRYSILAIGKMRNPALANLCFDFSGHLKRQGNFESIELKDGIVESEGRRILKALDKRPDAGFDYIGWGASQSAGTTGGFVIGTACGLSPTVKVRADQ